MSNESEPVPLSGAPSPESSPRAGCEISLQNPRRYPEAAARRLRPWLEALVAELAPGAASFAVRCAGDRELRRLNAVYRGRDRPTDVLSFPGEDADAGLVFAAGGEPPGWRRHLGDVAVSVPAARRQARARGHGAETELRILLLHGLLHCLGYDHETDDGTMERLERALRRRWIDHE